MVAFTPNTPQASQFPSTTQGPMLANNQYMNAFGSRDHQFTLESTNSNDGTHKQVTLSALGSSPGFAGANAVVYAKSVSPPAGSAATQLFYDAGTPVQLTSHTPVNAASGYSYLPGGLMVIWGITTVVANATISFPTDPATSAALKLSASAYAVQATFINSPGSYGFINITSVGDQSFTIQIRNSSLGNITAPISWTAIGPA